MAGQPVYDQFQVRILLKDAFADAAFNNPHSGMLKRVNTVLRKHSGALRNQLYLLDSFVGAFNAHATPGAEKPGFLLWTESVVNDMAKREKYGKMFVVAVKGKELMDEAVADALIHDMRRLEKDGILTGVMKISNDPARNPQLPAQFKK